MNLLGRESNKFKREWTTHDNLYMNIPKNNSHITCKMAIELLDFDSEWVRAKPFATKNKYTTMWKDFIVRYMWVSIVIYNAIIFMV